MPVPGVQFGPVFFLDKRCSLTKCRNEVLPDNVLANRVLANKVVAMDEADCP